MYIGLEIKEKSGIRSWSLLVCWRFRCFWKEQSAADATFGRVGFPNFSLFSLLVVLASRSSEAIFGCPLACSACCAQPNLFVVLECRNRCLPGLCFQVFCCRSVVFCPSPALAPSSSWTIFALTALLTFNLSVLRAWLTRSMRATLRILVSGPPKGVITSWPTPSSTKT